MTDFSHCRTDLERKVLAELSALGEESYADFCAKLTPTVPRERFLGVRMPKLREYAKAFGKTAESRDYLDLLPHRYYEENNVHAFLLESFKDAEELVMRLDAFLPYVDNWATCDSCRPKALAKHHDIAAKTAKRYVRSEHTYTVRFGIDIYMTYLLGEDFLPEYARDVCDIRSDEYYVNMMRAWYFAEGLVKRHDDILPYFTEKRLDAWTLGKAISKACDSFRIGDGEKAFLRSLRT